ncbi:MAG: lysophospholipid acyltransferase family protein [Planctomycetota bacterium]
MARDLLAKLPSLRRECMRLVAGTADRMPLGLSRTIAYNIGASAWFLDARGRKAVARNLAAAVPAGEPLRRAVRRSYTEFALTLAEAARLHHMPAEWLQSPFLTIVDPWRVFINKPLQGPAILVSVHSHWDMLAALMHRLGWYNTVLAPTLSYGDPALDQWLARRRDRWGCRTVAIDKAPLAMLRALREGRILGMLMDRVYAGHGVPTRFLGHERHLPIGPAALSIQTHAPIIPIFLARTSPSTFSLIVSRPERANPSLPRGEQVAELTTRIGSTMSRLLSAAPAQWVAFHDVT